jgi:asparagine synthetase B (glutamine-hydrolysing)
LTAPEPYRLSPLEVSCGLVFGVDRAKPPVPHLPRGMTPVQALEEAIRPALERAPCLVSFSGGRDSSAVLAVAAGLARREGLELPIPATNRFHGSTDADERDWQEQVVAHLGLRDWVALEFTDELDCVGPVATKVLRRHGLLWPFNAYFHQPLLAAARGGSLLTGAGGDEVLSPSSWTRAQAVLTGRALPEPRDLLRVGFALSPKPVRRRVIARRMPMDVLQWLHEPVQRNVISLWAAELSGEPVRWPARFRWWRRLRYVRVSLESLALLAADEDVQVVHPLADARFSTALGRLPRADRFSDRTDGMRLLFSGVLPEALLARRTKASFDQPFWSTHSRELVGRWNGEAVEASLVDLDALRDMWHSDSPDGRSFQLLQAVRLALDGPGPDSRGDGVEEQLGALSE